MDDPVQFGWDNDSQRRELPEDSLEIEAHKPDWAKHSPTTYEYLAVFLEKIGATEPRRMAGAVIREFGTASGALSASYWQLHRILGRKVALAVKASGALMRAALLEEMAKGPVLSNRQQVLQFIQFSLGPLRRERMIAMYLDSKCSLLRIDRIADGSIDEIAVNTASIIYRGLDVGASGFILVHNHPSGDATPSDADIRITQRLAWVARDLDMNLIDHLIVAGGNVSSVIWTQ